MPKIENLIVATAHSRQRKEDSRPGCFPLFGLRLTRCATALTLGLPLITADEKILQWNEAQRVLQVIGL